MSTQDKILTEINEAKNIIKTDGYPMSIGEVINLYKDGDITLNPAFQRLFRWDNRQKSRFIESILIGIPIPEIFVAQKEDGTWQVVDGVQRLSTILQLIGLLHGNEVLILESTKYIPSLENKTWELLPKDIQRSFKRSKLNINIILTQNTDEAQYELFQRLNTGGTSLSDQEIRNCLILMINQEFFNKINILKDYPNFKNCLNLDESEYKKETHMEYILRMYIGYAGVVDYEKHHPLNKAILQEFIDTETINIVKKGTINEFEIVFKKTFDKLYNSLKDESFKKFDRDSDRFKGPFNISAFEMITAGIAANIEQIEQLGNEDLIKKIKSLYNEEKIISSLKRGVRAIKRFKDITDFSKTYFRNK